MIQINFPTENMINSNAGSGLDDFTVPFFIGILIRNLRPYGVFLRIWFPSEVSKEFVFLRQVQIIPKPITQGNPRRSLMFGCLSLFGRLMSRFQTFCCIEASKDSVLGFPKQLFSPATTKLSLAVFGGSPPVPLRKILKSLQFLNNPRSSQKLLPHHRPHGISVHGCDQGLLRISQNRNGHDNQRTKTKIWTRRL